LILLDGGSKRWVLREILSTAPAEIIPHKRRKTA
jgi:hypothetical protein